ncbi:hypothetical protein JCM14467A_09990 [Vulcanisaeta sp. JCM 14467]
MNTWNEAVRLAAYLLRRLRDLNERAVRQYFTRDCLRFKLRDWHFDTEAMKCLRNWHIRALVSIASTLHPLIKAYGVETVESVVNDVDITKIDVREDLLRGLSSVIYEEVINHVTGNVRSAATSNDAVISRIINQGIGDLTSQITRIENLMKKCKGGTVNLEGEELDCQDLLLYDMELHQVLNELQQLARKYNITIEPDKRPWWLYE